MGAHRKHKHPTKVYPSNIRTLRGADFNALDAIVDTRNARGQGRWSRDMVMVERLREGIARDPDAPAEYVAAHDAAEAVKRGGAP